MFRYIGRMVTKRVLVLSVPLEVSIGKALDAL